MARSKQSARARPSAASACDQARIGASRLKRDYGKGVSKTLSGKFQARIVLYGKRYDLGTFDTKEEAAAAYIAAKQSGHTDRGSPQHNRIKRGTGTRYHSTRRLLPVDVLTLCPHVYNWQEKRGPMRTVLPQWCHSHCIFPLPLIRPRRCSRRHSRSHSPIFPLLR